MALPFVYEKKKPRYGPLGTAAGDVQPEIPFQPAYPVDIQPTTKAAQVPVPEGKPLVDPALLAAVRPAAPAPVVDPNLEAVYAHHNAERASRGLGPDAPLGPIATTDQDPTVVFERGRPTRAYGEDPLAAQEALKKSVDEYEPQKVTGWRKWLPVLLQGAGVAGAFASHDPRAAAQNALGLTRSLANPKFADEAWKQGKQAEVGAQVDDLYKQQDRAAVTAYRRAQADKLSRPAARPKRILKNSKGMYVAVDAETGLDKDGNPVQGAMGTESNDWVLHVNEAGEYVPVNKKTGLGQDGKPVKGKSMVQLEDGTFVDATSKYATDRQFGKEDRSLDLDNQKARFENEQLQKQKDEWTYERKQIDDSLKTTPRMVTRTRSDPYSGAKEEYQIENPVYDDLMTRRRAVNDKILGVKFQPIVKAPPRPSTVTTGRAKIPAKTNHALQLKELGIQ